MAKAWRLFSHATNGVGIHLGESINIGLCALAFVFCVSLFSNIRLALGLQRVHRRLLCKTHRGGVWSPRLGFSCRLGSGGYRILLFRLLTGQRLLLGRPHGSVWSAIIKCLCMGLWLGWLEAEWAIVSGP